MDPEAQAYFDALHMLFEDARETLRGLPAAALSWKPLPEGSNSMAVIVAHMCGSTAWRVYQGLTGEDIHRRREAEFQATAGGPEDVLAILDRTEEQARKALGGTDSRSLAEMGPSSILPVGTRRFSVSRAIGHLGEHVGHLQLTRQLWEGRKQEVAVGLLQEVAGLLTSRGKTVAVAEVDTCGLAGYWLSTVPGASRFLPGGVIAYSNSAKRKVLDISEELLTREGSVSEAVALELARKVRQLLDTDIAVSNTGIAGPTGGRSGKPVGLFYIAIAARDGYEKCLKKEWKGDRDANKQQTALAMLELSKEYLQQGG